MSLSKGIPPAVLAALHRIEPGADFSESGYQIQSLKTNRCYFVKFGLPREVEQFQGEAESLRVMYSACPGICPRLYEFSVDEETKRPLFISDYKRISSSNDSEDIGRQLGEMLAEMHLNGKSPTGKFGFDVPTYCGNTRMRNTWYTTWAEAYDEKIGDLLDTLLKTSSAYKELCTLGNELREKAIPRLLGPLKITPVILHGDLWSGNAGSDENNKPVIFDPSAYYGHNEADLSIARIFGGFPPAFFSAYHEKIAPADPMEEYETRGALYEVFHYLNHTVLFGGSYSAMARQKIGVVMRYVLHNKKVAPLHTDEGVDGS